ncbi:MAG: lipoyl protein ligase domain-containing protein [Thiohalorhabdus sp.]
MSDAGRIRVWDDGPADAGRNRRLDLRQWRLAREAGQATLRFHRSAPAASLGAFENARHALRPDHCRRRGIPIVRRPTGGGALYLDGDQVLWTLALPEGAPTEGLAIWQGRLGQALARALLDLGIPAAFNGSDALEVEGRKLGALTLRTGDGVVLAHGTLLLDVDVETMLGVLRVPKEKLTPEGLAGARQRLATLAELQPATANPRTVTGTIQARLGQAVGRRFERGAPRLPTEPPEALASPRLLSTEEPLEAFLRVPGGVLYAALAPGRDQRTVAEAQLSGPLHLAPPDLLRRLGDHLEGSSLEAAPERARRFLADTDGELVGFGPEEVARAVALAAERARQQEAFQLDREGANTLMVHDPEGREDAASILARARRVLVPYCAKPTWCKWRHRDGCPDCGKCEVGDVYRMARERGLPVTTVRNFEHLTETLEAMGTEGVEAYVGMCCGNFFLKREYAFREAGLPAVLLDIAGANCYELGREEAAYRGAFEAQAELNGEVTRRVLAHLPGKE